ncbi:MAG: NDP-sugar synthase [Candidatus Eremiobacteraeota bacterium]|nr:NDP-sugar synthase [Candidatus Eremiobacteraeota bacterium]
MILAGGLSTRLYPLTKNVPKPLVPVAGVPNVIHVIRYLRAYGFEEIAINLHYLSDAIMATLGDGSRFGISLHYSYEPELLGSAGAIKKMQPFFGADTFVVIGCDDLTDLPLDRMLAFHRERQAIASIGLVRCEEMEQYGVVEIDERGRVLRFQEKPPKGTEISKLANTGVYAFSPAIHEWIPRGEFYDFGKQVFPALQRAAEDFFGFEARGSYWADIGTPSEYRRASYDLVNGTFTIPGVRGNGIDPSAELGEGVRTHGPLWVGARTRIGDGVTIAGPSVVGNDAIVEPNARLERTIVWDGATIGAGASLRDTIVGTNYRVASDATLTDAVVANEEIPAS